MMPTCKGTVVNERLTTLCLLTGGCKSTKKRTKAMPLNLIDVEEVYRRHAKLKRSDVAAILEWAKAQPHLPELIELQAILCLHSCYYDMEAAKQTVDNYFTCRTRYLEYFQHAPEDVVRRLFSVNFVSVLPRRTPEDDMIVTMKFLQTSPRLFNCLEHIRVSVMILTLYIHQNSPAEGLILLFDMEGASFGHLFKMNVLAVKRMIGFLQEAAPVRIRALHFVNAAPVTGKLLALLKPFMKTEVAESIKVHSTSLNSLYEYIPKNCLPEDYGGALPPVRTLHEECLTQLLDNSEFFQWHDLQKVDESKRGK